MFISVPPATAQVKAANLYAQATARAKRTRGLPDVATCAELGFAEVAVDANYGPVAPAGIRTEVIARLRAAVAKAAQTPDLRERYAVLGLEALSNTPGRYTAYTREGSAKWRKVVGEAKLKPQ